MDIKRFNQRHILALAFLSLSACSTASDGIPDPYSRTGMYRDPRTGQVVDCNVNARAQTPRGDFISEGIFAGAYKERCASDLLRAGYVAIENSR